jgi:hypothetical protein
MKARICLQVVFYRKKQLYSILLKYDTNVLAHFKGPMQDIKPENRCGTACGSRQRRQDPEESGLPGAVRSENSEYLALAHLKAQAVKCPDSLSCLLFVYLDEIGNLNHRTTHGSALFVIISNEIKPKFKARVRSFACRSATIMGAWP